MKNFSLKILIQTIVFLIIINFEILMEGKFPLFLTLVVQSFFIVLFFLYFHPKQNGRKKNEPRILNKVIFVLLLLVVMNMDHIVNGQIPSPFHFFLVVLISLAVVFWLLPKWREKERVAD